jgi:hypothetical protein
VGLDCVRVSAFVAFAARRATYHLERTRKQAKRGISEGVGLLVCGA